MNNFEIVKLWDSMRSRPLLFLNVMKEEAKLRNNNILLQYIKELINSIKRYAAYSTVGALKGLNPFAKKEDEDIYDYTSSKEFEVQMKGLWTGLGITEEYFSSGYMQMYELLQDHLIDTGRADLIPTIRLNTLKNFVFGTDEKQVVRVFSRDEWEKIKAFAAKDEVLKSYDIESVLNSDLPGGFALLNMENPVMEKYMTLAALDRISEPSQEPVEDKKEEAMEGSSESESVTEEWVDFGKNSEGKLDKEKLKNDNVAFKMELFKILEEDSQKLKNIEIKFTMSEKMVDGKAFEDGKEYIAIQIPRGYKENDKFVVTGENTQSAGQYVLIPRKNMEEYQYQVQTTDSEVQTRTGYRVVVNVGEQFTMCDKDGKALYTDSTNSKELTISGVVLADHVSIAASRTISSASQRDGIFIDGKQMQLYSMENGLQFAYDEEKAVLLTYSGIEKNVQIPEYITIAEKNIPLTEIKDGAFKNTLVESVTVPNGVVEIRNYVFSGCENLKEVSLPDSLRCLGSYSFENCSALKSITLPAKAELLGRDIFSGTSIKEFKVAGEGSLLVKDGALYNGNVLYCFANGSDQESFKVVSGTKVIESGAFEKNAGIKSVNISGVVEIKDRAFNDCLSLSSVVGTSSIENIGAYAFSGVPVPHLDLSAVESVGNHAFNMSGLKEVSLPKVKSIEDFAFANSQDLKKVSINMVGLNKTSYSPVAFSGSDNIQIHYENLTPQQEKNLREYREDLSNDHAIVGDYKKSDVEEIAKKYINEKLKSAGITAQIVGISVYGSRLSGLAKFDSDIDIVVEFKGEKIKEDALYDLLHEDKKTIGGIVLDITPITAENSGTIEQYLNATKGYRKPEIPSRGKENMDIVRRELTELFAKQPNQSNIELYIPKGKAAENYKHILSEPALSHMEILYSANEKCIVQKLPSEEPRKENEFRITLLDRNGEPIRSVRVSAEEITDDLILYENCKVNVVYNGMPNKNPHYEKPNEEMQVEKVQKEQKKEKKKHRNFGMDV